MGNQPEPAIGIDLGTTYSVVAQLDRDGKPLTLANDEGDLTTPSVVYFDKSSTVVGREAIKAAEFEPERVARFAKRDMGEGFYHRAILGNQLPPEVIQAVILKKLKHDAELRIGSMPQAVITVPAYFNEPRRKATQDAGRLAGIKVLDIVNEPTAAAIAYGVQQGFLTAEGESHERELVLVYDLGGGTFDVTLMEIEGRSFKAIATAGDVHLGGIDWDQSIVNLIVDQFQDEHGIDLHKASTATEALTDEAIRIKHALTARDETTVRFGHDGKRVQFETTRADFERRTAGLLDRTRMTVKRLLKDAKFVWPDITRLLLVGGSTRMPMVQAMLEKESGLQVDRSLSPDEAVAHGAAIYAGMLLAGSKGVKQTFAVRNVSSHDLGVMGLDTATGRPRRHVMIPRNSHLPCKRASNFKTAKKNQKSVAVRIVEGGTDAGQGATQIGKCVVHGLPKELPKGTDIKVVFQYRADGRLAVLAGLPDGSSNAQTVIERAVGMSKEQFETWRERLATGLIIELIDPAEEPLDVSDIESLLASDEGTVEVSDSPSKVEHDPKLLISEQEETTEPNPSQGTGDAALDDFLKGIG